MLLGVTFIEKNSPDEVEIIFNNNIINDNIKELHEQLDKQDKKLFFNMEKLNEFMFYMAISKISSWCEKNKENKIIHFVKHSKNKDRVLENTLDKSWLINSVYSNNKISKIKKFHNKLKYNM